MRAGCAACCSGSWAIYLSQPFHPLRWHFCPASIILGIAGARDLNVLSRGEVESQSLGVAIKPARIALFWATTAILTATAVTIAGGIGFIGLLTAASGATHRRQRSSHRGTGRRPARGMPADAGGHPRPGCRRTAPIAGRRTHRPHRCSVVLDAHAPRASHHVLDMNQPVPTCTRLRPSAFAR